MVSLLFWLPGLPRKEPVKNQHETNDLGVSLVVPDRGVKVDNDNFADVQAHYEYLANHDAINEKLDALKKIGLES